MVLKGNKFLFWLSLACVVALIVMIVALCIPKKAEQKPFTPPPFDSNAVQGEPTVPEGLGYNILHREGMSFKVGVCGKITVKKSTVDIYLTNVAENNAWLKARFYNAKGEIVGESGLIKPGEYLQSVVLESVPNESEQYTVKIMSYEPDTYKSLGAVTLNPKIVIQ